MISENRFRLKKDGTPNKKCFCRNPELIENYEKAIADTTQTWECHHRLETHNSDGERRLVDITQKELIELGMYYDRPPKELIFLTASEHSQLHNKGKHLSEETKAKLSAVNKGRTFSEEWKAKISDANKGHSAWIKGKHHSEETKAKMSALKKGKHWRTENGRRVWY